MLGRDVDLWVGVGSRHSTLRRYSTALGRLEQIRGKHQFLFLFLVCLDNTPMSIRIPKVKNSYVLPRCCNLPVCTVCSLGSRRCVYMDIYQFLDICFLSISERFQVVNSVCSDFAQISSGCPSCRTRKMRNRAWGGCQPEWWRSWH